MDTKKTKKNKMKKYQMSDKIHFIENADKDTGGWMEIWDKGRSLGCIPHSFRLLALGGCGRG